MSAPPAPSTSDPRAAASGPRRVDRLLTALVWTALALAPVLYLIESGGPRWLNLTLRGVWVAVVVVVGALVLRGRVRRRRPDDGAVA